MAVVIKNLYHNYQYLFHEFEDPRIEKYPFVHSPLPMAIVIILYLFFVNKWGPNWMLDRKPFDLKNVIKFYNLFQVIYNLWFSIHGWTHSYMRSDFSWSCQPVDWTNNMPYMEKLIFVSYMYYLSKYMDLFDTIFFVLRKKNSQITFLHVYHHAGMVFGVYIFIKFLAGSHSTMLGVINGVVHVIMYSYYFLTSISEDSTKYHWCKKYITQLQLLQFAYLIVHFTIPLINNSCTHPKLVSIVGVIQNAFMFALFLDFYYKAYVKKKTITTTK